MYQIIDGKKISQEIKDELREKVTALKGQGKQICLAVIQVGSDPASSVYVGNKKKACAYIGIESLAYELPEETTEQEINEEKVIQTIAPEKDVDGFHEKNVGALCVGSKGYVSCTPLGIIQLLKRSGVEIAGKHCVVIGRSNIVGKPMALLLLRENGTVTVCHSRTQNLKEITKQADILVVAIGKPKFVDESYIKEGAVVIDVGIHRDENNKLCGDVDFEKAAPHASAITPVPGGVGPMTIAMLMYNCVSSAEQEDQVQ